MNKKCPICQHEDFHSVFYCIDHFVSQESFEIIACDNCGMRITDDFPNEKNIGKYYENQNYISHSDTKKGFVNRIYHHVRQRMLKKKAKWIESQTNSKKGYLLDVGAGTGYFAAMMKNRNWQVDTVEQSEDARTFAENQFGLNPFSSIEQFSTENSAKNGASLDVITLWHVLEHLEKLNESMSQFYHLLKPDGTLVIAIPNCESYDAGIYQNQWAAYDVPRHVWHFTEKQMQVLAKNHGFTITKIKRMPFDAFYISMMSEKYNRSSFPLVKGLWTGFCGFILSIFNKNYSSSLVYFLRKED